MKSEKNKSNKKKETRFWLQKIILFNAATFLILSFFCFPFSFPDMQIKYAMASETILTVNVIGMPAKTVVTANTICDQGVPVINLSWTETNDTYYYNIERDGVALASGLAATNYRDTAISENTAYEYEVTAVGKVGNTTSDPVTVTSSNNCSALPVPTVSIGTVDDIQIHQGQGVIDITNRRPVFTGNTNMPNAIIQIEILGAVPVLSEIQANINGYWTWQPPVNLGRGFQIVTVTAIDPLDISRRKTISVEFNVKEKSKSEKDEDKKTKQGSGTVNVMDKSLNPATADYPEIIFPFRLSINVENQGKEVRAGQELFSRVYIQKIGDFSPQEVVLHYKIYDSEGRTVMEMEDQIFIGGNADIRKKIKMPGLLNGGNYKIFVNISFNGVLVNAADSFTVIKSDTGGGAVVPMKKITEGRIIVLLYMLLILPVFIVLLLREYYLSKQAKIQITGEFLHEKEFF